MGSLLNWPAGYGRTPESEREPGNQFSARYSQTRSELAHELESLMGVENWRLDDVTGSGGDPGVVVRWTKNGQDFAVACDAYTSKKANIRSAYLYIREMRKAGDRPVETSQDQFAAAALPPGDGEAIALGDHVEDAREPWEVLQVSPDASEAVVRAAARQRKAETHPDSEGGDREEFQRVKEAEVAMMEMVSDG